MSRRFMNSKKKKRASVDERVIHDEEYGEENVQLVDEEWADFERILHDYKERRLLQATMDKAPKKKAKKRQRTQTFYPCPPPEATADDDDTDDDDDAENADDADRSSDDGFVTTLVSYCPATRRHFACPTH